MSSNKRQLALKNLIFVFDTFSGWNVIIFVSLIFFVRIDYIIFFNYISTKGKPTSLFPKTFVLFSEFILYVYIREYFPLINKSQYLPNGSYFRVSLIAMIKYWIAV